VEWLKGRLAARGDFSLYEECRELAHGLGVWPDVRPILLGEVRSQGQRGTLVEIHLLEGEIDAALDLVTAKQPLPGGALVYDSARSLRLQVAEAAEETRPREALELYRVEAERLIGQRGREQYRQACGFLGRMKRLWERVGEGAAWDEYLSDLRERTRPLRALREELAAAGL
jgi:uncharacterized Zn finger protein